MLLQPNDPNHGDICRDYDFTRQPANPTTWTCPPGCDYKDSSPWCAQEGTMDPCRVEEGKDCGSSVCPFAYPILCPDKKPCIQIYQIKYLIIYVMQNYIFKNLNH